MCGGAAPAECTELDVHVVGGLGHVGAREHDAATVNDDGLGVQLRLRRIALVYRPVVGAVLGIGSCVPTTVEVLGGFQNEVDSNAAVGGVPFLVMLLNEATAI